PPVAGPTYHGTVQRLLPMSRFRGAMRPSFVAFALALATPAAAAPRINVTPLQFDYGVVAVGKQASINIQVANVRGADLTVTAVTLGGQDPQQFALAGAPKQATTVAPGMSFTFTAIFAPKAGGNFQAVVTIASDDPKAPTSTVALSGSGVVPPLA